MKKQSAFTLRSGNKPSIAKFMGVSPMKADLEKKQTGPRAEKSESEINRARMFEKYDSQIQEVREDIFQERITKEAAAEKIKQLEKLRDKYKA